MSQHGRDLTFEHYGILVTEFMSKLDGLWAFCSATTAYTERLSEQEWRKPDADHDENKWRMKILGGLVFQFRRLVKEFSIIGISKIVEDLIGVAERVIGISFNIWQNDDLRLLYHRNVRYVRALGNVIKHSQSVVVDDGQPSNTFLIAEYGLTPGQEIEWMDFDIKRHIFFAHDFLCDLTAYLTGTERQPVDDEERAFDQFKGEMDSQFEFISF